MKICVLASGSSGNCIFISSPQERVLIDAGLSARETARRLDQVGVPISTISAVCLTHEHSDHIAGLAGLHQRHGIKLFANSGTIEAICRNDKMRELKWNIFSTGAPFQIGDLTFDPFPVSHDAYEPVGFVVKCADTRLGIVTDIGAPTHLVREHLRHCRALIIEANHDEYLLADARRPWVLKQRIAGRQGHLSNAHAAQMIAEIASPALAHVFLCHLSLDCNRPELALKEVKKALDKVGYKDVQVKLTFAGQISEIWSDEEAKKEI
ncbi:MAG: MBL fold metallo-hydrolase [Kiritimatiellia bacterium]|nr:MBL fold metallo-hydrolase [Kiritimatiellia bacterium]